MQSPAPNGSNQAEMLVGRVLGGTYHILAMLEEGGMGRLYRAEHLRLHRPIAVKVLAQHLANDPSALARFQREAEIVSQLHHPHIVHILDFDATNESAPYIVMELLQGESLAKRMNRERMLPIEDVVRIVSQVSSALGAAHQQGIVHRDLKPDNVFIQEVDQNELFVKLLDFGISKSATASNRVTREFDLLGTPDYIAPEQVMSTANADHRADQYALASMTYEMLTGHVPFGAESIAELLRKILHETPPRVSSYVSGLGPMLDEVLLRALAKSPDARFVTVQEYAYALAQATGVPLYNPRPGAFYPTTPPTHRTPSRPPQDPTKYTPMSAGSVEAPGPLASPTSNGQRTPRSGSRPSHPPPYSPVLASLPREAEPRPAELVGRGQRESTSLGPIPPSKAGESPASNRGPRPSVEPPAPQPAPGSRHPARPKLRSFTGEEHLSTDDPRLAPRPMSDAPPASLRPRSSPAPGNAGECLEQLRAAIADVRRAVVFGEHQRAASQARRAVHLVRSCDEREARNLLVEASSVLEFVLLRSLGGPSKQVTLRDTNPARGDFTPGHFFLLSRLEQPITLDELLDLSPLSRPETLGFIMDLLSQGIVGLD